MGAHGYPNYNLQGVRQQFGNRFDPQDLSQLRTLPSGLLGPIQLVAAVKTSRQPLSSQVRGKNVASETGGAHRPGICLATTLSCTRLGAADSSGML
jgi:hypothetical protein